MATNLDNFITACRNQLRSSLLLDFVSATELLAGTEFRPGHSHPGAKKAYTLFDYSDITETRKVIELPVLIDYRATLGIEKSAIQLRPTLLDLDSPTKVILPVFSSMLLQLVLTHLGFVYKRFETPENIVKLPVPPWAIADPATAFCFKSERNSIISKWADAAVQLVPA